MLSNNPLPVHVCVSDTHRLLLEEHFKPTFNANSGGRAVLKVHNTPQLCADGVIFHEGWRDQVRHKVRVTLEACSSREIFVCSDVDVVFLKPWVDDALKSLHGVDLAWMGEPSFSPGFFIAKGSAQLEAMLQDLLDHWGQWRGDGEAMIYGLKKHKIKHHRLPETFGNPGILGYPIPILSDELTFKVPENVAVFHANFCERGQKDLMLRKVRQQAAEDARVGFGFFPSLCPDRPFDRQSMLSRDKMRDIITAVGDRPLPLIVEIGCWLGGSTRWFLETFGPPHRIGEPAAHSHLICIDPWTGVPRFDSEADLASRMVSLWEQWCTNCWNWRHAITPVKLTSRLGIKAIAGELLSQGRQPDMVYIDGDHTEDECYLDIMDCARHWPTALIIGDDYDLIESEDKGRQVERAVEKAAKELCRTVHVGSSGTWWLSES